MTLWGDALIRKDPIPLPVKWYRSTLRLEPTERHRIENRGSRHELIFNSVQKEDFANYTCQADNVQGRTRQDVILSGKPHQGVIVSPDVAKSRDSYNISWTITSYAAIDEYRLYFRKAPIGSTPSNAIENDPISNKKSLRKSAAHGFKEWTDIVIQGDDVDQNEEKSLTHEKSYLIRALEPSTQYEAKLQARNIFGWNQMSDTFRFTTRGMDGISREPTPEAILPAEMRDLGVKAKDSSMEERASWLLVALTLSLIL
ncbi:hypothetical protein GE061_010401 [Apolygus lucorum]|uniref:Ig-like domain-containing protein n=1 Tax=Apolygus lucorum TaxID=248454 RepID=A0A8S9Y730_APOLU|nr:hypothetical protein GE061_010401 [Apolygus lucorum]